MITDIRRTPPDEDDLPVAFLEQVFHPAWRKAEARTRLKAIPLIGPLPFLTLYPNP